MKSSLVIAAIVASLSSVSIAAPTSTGNKGGDWSSSWGKSPFEFTSTYHIMATPDQVINGTNRTPGEPGARGHFNFGINSNLNTICYNITLYGVTGAYQSPALTATHIHQAASGASGPPRIAFPNPVGDDNVRRSAGCLTGPFTTGIMSNGADSGVGFHVSQIEANPAGFFCDTHTAKYVPGAVRGQLA